MPSRVTSVTLPATGAPCRAKKIADGFLTSRKPSSLMTKKPISFAAPKRFLTARTMRKRLPTIAFEVQHGVDHVLEHARPCERALLRDVADQQRRNVARLREPRELRGALAHLAHGARRRLQLLAEQRLDRIDGEHAELVARRDAREHRFDAGLREHVERRFADSETLRSQPDLLERLLARDVTGRNSRREIRERSQQQRRFADAGIAADQHDAARHEAAAEHAVELAETRRQPLDGADVDAIETRELDLAGVLRALGTLRQRDGFGQRVPGAAIGALALPLRLLPAAIAAGVDRSRLRHGARIAELERTDRGNG